MRVYSLAQPDLLFSFVWGREKSRSGCARLESLCFKQTTDLDSGVNLIDWKNYFTKLGVIDKQN